MFGSIWGFFGGFLIIGVLIIWMKIKDYIFFEEDFKFFDEIVEDVIVGCDIKKGEEVV